MQAHLFAVSREYPDNGAATPKKWACSKQYNDIDSYVGLLLTKVCQEWAAPFGTRPPASFIKVDAPALHNADN